MSDRPAKFGAEDLRQVAWRNSYLKSKDEQEFHTAHPIPRVSKFGIKRDSLPNKTTLPPLVEDCIPSVARHGVFNNEPMPPKNPWYKRRTSLPSNVAYKHQVLTCLQFYTHLRRMVMLFCSFKETLLNSITHPANILVHKVKSWCLDLAIICLLYV